ncbi:hypothetical protein [Nannocystis radixulma]|uniref:Uncharacterized protein n=1 Tax=Nannocystis radixulma TaxID=2995305 RepID=A0ABT5B2Z0_9BACT|nr:hypothetical protein [Nannocystis radixulma]MDC0667904.1 hypothetical protein [Nannocystis radixulma]
MRRPIAADDPSSIDAGPAAHERVRRPPPARTGPIRDGSRIFRAPPEPRMSHPSSPEPAPPSARPSLEEGVAAAYRVYDEYMQRGQDAARSRGDSWSDSRPPAYPDLARRAIRFWSDAIGMMFDAVGPAGSAPGRSNDRTSPSGFERAAEPGPWSHPRSESHATRFDGAFARPEPSPAREGTAILLRLDVGRPAEVRIHLAPEAAGRSLATSALVALDVDGAPPLRDVRLAHHGALDLTLNLPPDQPAGTYSGSVLDELRGDPLGRLTVTLRR